MSTLFWSISDLLVCGPCLSALAAAVQPSPVHHFQPTDVVLSLIVVSALLCVTVIQGQNGWGVTYTSTEICASKGSTVEMSCTYTYPSWLTVQKTFWFTKLKGTGPVDLTTDSEYSGRVQNICDNNKCTLRITDLRESDSAEYKFRFITNHPEGKHTGLPGVTLSVTAKYTWYKEKQKLPQRSTGIYHFTSISSEDRGNYYCKSENQHGQIDSSSLFIDVQYAPKLPSVSVSPSAEIVENSSVTLTCSSDANPAADYTWYKENEDSPKASGQIFTITDFRPEHSGNYYCEAQNRRGRHNSTLHLIVVAGQLSTFTYTHTVTSTLTAVARR
uniref:B-cell receptor CD22 n=1 Tax=Larimichthys crocea TaxID=215358 RepID=A0A0F8AMK8_LARCR